MSLRSLGQGKADGGASKVRTNRESFAIGSRRFPKAARCQSKDSVGDLRTEALRIFACEAARSLESRAQVSRFGRREHLFRQRIVPRRVDELFRRRQLAQQPIDRRV